MRISAKALGDLHGARVSLIEDADGVRTIPELSARIKHAACSHYPEWSYRSSGVFPICTFGSTGTPDDTDVIQAAINELSAAGGGIIDLGGATYRVRSLAINAGYNVGICGSGATLFGIADNSAIISVSGFQKRRTRTPITGIVLNAEASNVVGIQSVTGCLIEHVVSTDKVVSAVKMVGALDTVIRDCFLNARDYGVLFIGTTACYSGFSGVYDSRIGGGKCAIYCDSRAYQGGCGGLTLNRVWFEGEAGLAIYSTKCGSNTDPHKLTACWIESMATAETLDFSDVGGHSAHAVAGCAIVLDASYVEIDSPKSGIRLQNGSLARLGLLNIYPDVGLGKIECDATSMVTADSVCIVKHGGVFIPRSIVATNYIGQALREVDPPLRYTTQYPNRMLPLGECSALGFSASGGVTAAIVSDTSVPVIGKCIEFMVPAGATINYWGGATDSSIDIGMSYVFSFAMKIISSGFGSVRVDLVNKVPEVPIAEISDGAWHYYTMWFTADGASTGGQRVTNNTDAPVVVRVSHLQLTAFSDRVAAYRYSEASTHSRA